MKNAKLPIKELEVIAGTRFVFGIGVGILLGRRLSRAHRRRIGWTLVLLGALSTPPILYDVFKNRATDE
jgi:hypothetical protein